MQAGKATKVHRVVPWGKPTRYDVGVGYAIAENADCLVVALRQKILPFRVQFCRGNNKRIR